MLNGYKIVSPELGTASEINIDITYNYDPSSKEKNHENDEKQ
jgi:hypothetical protein